MTPGGPPTATLMSRGSRLTGTRVGVNTMSAVFGAHGHTFAVRVDAPDLAARIEQALVTLRVEEEPRGLYAVRSDDEGRPALYFDQEWIGSPSTDDRLLLLLHWHINQRVIESAASRHTTLHAAAARSPRGGTVLLPAPMESGKTTTVTGLLQSGWDFLTDEAAAVSPDGCVRAYHKPLTIDHGSWGLFPDLRPAGVAEEANSWLVPATATGAKLATTGRLALIAFPTYAHGERTRAERLDAVDAALQLAHSTFHFDLHGSRDLRCVAALARSIPTYRLTIGDLATAVELINELEIQSSGAAA